MLDIFSRIVELIAPPHPSSILLSSVSTDAFCMKYGPQYIHSCVSLSSYHDPIIKAAITTNKFYNDAYAAQLLASMLYVHLSSLPPAPTVLIPIPLSKRRERERGYNQVTRVLSSLPKHDWYQISLLLKRTKHTQSQTTLHRTERIQNMQNVFSLSTATLQTNQTRYIIIDDVLTTGATLQAAKAAILPNLNPGSTLICLALAH